MTSPSHYLHALKQRLKTVSVFGWRLTQIRSLLRFAIKRIVQGQLAQVAGSLTFTTVLALVPLLNRATYGHKRLAAMEKF